MAPSSVIQIRDVCSSDLEAITAIFNFYITTSVCSFREEPVDCAFMQKKVETAYRKDYPFLVAVEKASGTILGYTYLSSFRDSGPCNRLAEISIYLVPESRGKGLGDLLYGELFSRIKPLVETNALTGIMAIITTENEGSIRFHEKHGFQPTGIWRKSGIKFGRLLDVVAMQLLLCEKTDFKP